MNHKNQVVKSSLSIIALSEHIQNNQQTVFKEVDYWADNHLLASLNLYRLVDNASNQILIEFTANSLNEALKKCTNFLRYGRVA